MASNFLVRSETHYGSPLALEFRFVCGNSLFLEILRRLLAVRFVVVPMAIAEASAEDVMSFMADSASFCNLAGS